MVEDGPSRVLIDDVPTIPTNNVDHTGLILGVVAIVGLVVLGLAFLSRKGQF